MMSCRRSLIRSTPDSHTPDSHTPDSHTPDSHTRVQDPLELNRTLLKHARLSVQTLLGILVLVSLTGCQSWLGRENTKQTVQGVSVLHSSGAEQFSYIKQQNSLVRLCTETDTDVESTAGGGFSISAAGDSIGDESSSGAVTLGGRDPTVLITRELMFRACELALNTNLKASDAEKVYAGTLKALIKIIRVHKGVGTTSVSAAPVVDRKMFKNRDSSSSTASNQAKSDKVSNDFSGFSWDDYSDKTNTIEEDHP